MPEPIFKNPDLQALFDKQGFVVVPFLNNNETATLTNFFHQIHANIPHNVFASSSYSSNYEYKKNISTKITELFSIHFERYFMEYAPIGGAFLYKTPGNCSQLMIHQDWTIVDEQKYYAINVWVPLVDTNEQNGTLFVLPGSHLIAKTLRAPTLPFFFTGKEDLVLKELVPINVPAGTAIIINHSLIHYSPPNLTDKIRIAITAGVISKNAQLLFYFKDPNAPQAQVEVFEQKPDFLLRFDNFHQDIFERPKTGKSIGYKPYDIPTLTNEQLKSSITATKEAAGYPSNRLPECTPTKKTWWKRITSLYRQ